LCRALLKLLGADAADLIEMFGFTHLLDDLEQRLLQPSEHAASGRIISAINNGNPMKSAAGEFNQAAEKYYRENQRRLHMAQALKLLQEDLSQIENNSQGRETQLRQELEEIMAGRSVQPFLQTIKTDLLSDKLGVQPLVRLLNLMLLGEQRDRLLNTENSKKDIHGTDTSVHRAL